MYGGVCICCGENILDFLNIDHLDRCGKQDRINGFDSPNIYRALVKTDYHSPKNLRVLCYNCNCAMGNYNVCHCNSDNFTSCLLCGIELSENIKFIGDNKPTTYHSFFRNSNINMCLDCIYELKHGKDLTALARINLRKGLNLRTKIIEGYGSKCECCSESRYIFLTVDHIHFHDGRYDWELYRYLIKNNYPKDNYRLLCYNCNCGRGHNGSDGICPHKKTDTIKLAI